MRRRGALAGLVVGVLSSVPAVFAAVVATAFGDAGIAALEVPFVVVSILALAAVLPLGWLVLRGSGAARPFAAAAWSSGVVLVSCALITAVMVLVVALVVALTVAFLWTGDFVRPVVWAAGAATLVLTLAVSIPTTAAFASGLRAQPESAPHDAPGTAPVGVDSPPSLRI